MKHLQMYVNGNWIDSSNNETIDVINPANGEVIATIPNATKEDVDQAVQAANEAFRSEEWRTVKAYERGLLLYKIADQLEANKDEFAKLETLDVGKPLSQGYADVEAAIRYFRFYAGAADKVMGDTIPVQDGIINYVVREPVGVTAHIIPWNYPLQIISRSVAAAIATGNTVVVKSAEDTPLSALKLTELFAELDIPAGVFNHVTGYGKEAGAHLAGHPNINHVTFTGSVGTGIHVGQAAMGNVVSSTLELGGKSPQVVFADCDFEAAVETVVRAIVQNAGQTCSAGARLLVEEPIKEQFLEALKEKFSSLSIGPGIDDHDLGPILNERQFTRIKGMVDRAAENGKILYGGKRVEVPNNEGGFYLEPTIIDGVDVNSEIAQDEVFGPVITVFTFKDEEEAIKLANSTDYGLVTGIWTKNIDRAHYLASRIDAGQIFVNNYGAGGGIEMPFGGYKKSGIGREKGWAALENYIVMKNVAVKFK